MKLYLVERTDNEWDYDQYDSFVCWANSEDEARHTSPSEYYEWREDGWYFQYYNKTAKKKRHDWPADPKTLKVWELSRPPEKPTVVLASYNAG